MTAIYPLPGPGGSLRYMCCCGRQFETMTEAVLCDLSHGEEEK